MQQEIKEVRCDRGDFEAILFMSGRAFEDNCHMDYLAAMKIIEIVLDEYWTSPNIFEQGN